jgi:hypothetical protein
MECHEGPGPAEYSTSTAVIENLPYSIMLLLGAAILAVALAFSTWAWIAGAAYIVYGILGSFCIILFLCPCCPSYGTRACPCGYGTLAAKLRRKGDPGLFTAKFRQLIPIIVPLWFIPPLVAALPLYRSFSWALGILLAAFALDAFLILPFISKSHGCKACPQRQACPWMGAPKQATGPTLDS